MYIPVCKKAAYILLAEDLDKVLNVAAKSDSNPAPFAYNVGILTNMAHISFWIVLSI